ncbi:MAG: 3-dehydroquinate synthase [Acidobacteriota bacterium]
MLSIHVDLQEQSYDILIEAGLLQRLAEVLKGRGLPERLFLVSNPRVFELYGSTVMEGLSEGFSVEEILIADGEQHKNLDTAATIYTALIERRADRSCGLIALGGGVTGDIAGFAAATFLRGIPYIQIPTTLLAQVDSSVGGKTGVNHPLGKNLIGAFHQPRLVCIDPQTLSSLPERDYRSGLYEVVKYGLIRDGRFFEFLESNLDALLDRDSEVLQTVIRRCCQIKAEVTSQDEREGGLRRILNLGHTFGHALEAATGYNRLTHGEAVGYGIKAAAALSARMGRLSPEDSHRAARLIDGLGERPSAPVPFSTLYQSMQQDKKRSRGALRFVVLEAIGEAAVVEAPALEDLEKAWGEAVSGG